MGQNEGTGIRSIAQTLLTLSRDGCTIRSRMYHKCSTTILISVLRKVWNVISMVKIQSPVRSRPSLRAADAEIKVPSGENTEFKRSPFKAWSRSVYSHTCYAYCQEFLAYFYPSSPFTCIFFQNLSWFSPALAVANTNSCVGLQNKIGHPAGYRFPCWVLAAKHDLWYNGLWNE